MGRRAKAQLMHIYGVCAASARFRSGSRRRFHAYLRYSRMIRCPISKPMKQKMGVHQQMRVKNLCVFTAFCRTLRPTCTLFPTLLGMILCELTVFARGHLFFTLKKHVSMRNMRGCSGLGAPLARPLGLLWAQIVCVFLVLSPKRRRLQDSF